MWVFTIDSALSETHPIPNPITTLIESRAQNQYHNGEKTMRLDLSTAMFLTLVASGMYVGSAIADDDRVARGWNDDDRGHSKNRPRLTEILVAELVELGDNQPTWETTVRIKQGKLRRSTYAAVEFVAVGVWEGTSSNLIVNGREYVLPISEPLWWSDIPLRGKTVIPIPVGVLRSGYNTIRIQSGPINNPTNQYDDFVVANIVLVLSH